jgi:hypothetical protein
MALGMGIDGQWTAVPGTLRRMGQAQSAKAKLDLYTAVDKATGGVPWLMPEEAAVALQKDPTGATLGTNIDVKVRQALLKASVDAAHAEREQTVKEAKAPIAAPAAPGAKKPA